jgi:XTP/dITP diphosphohydrolase
VRSARWSADCGHAPAGPAVDAANNRLLLTLLAPVPGPRRPARFFAAVHAVIVASGQERAASGSVEGFVAEDEQGAGGFGYDPLFVVDDGPAALRGRRMAELTADEKHGISHRGRALRALLAALPAGLLGPAAG